MNETEIIDITREAVLLTIQLGAPALLTGLIVGLSVSLLQALTQVQEITLVFVPKILAMFLSLFFFLPWMVKMLTAFMETLADKMIGLG